ncbi:MAG TPA: hypothetical protein VFR37_19400 [Longimicrobium sp.]|nr:hypothetical protein [Longimicrobium sp.]
MRTFAGLVILGIALLLLVVEITAIRDPAGYAPHGIPEPWFMYAGRLAVVALMGWISLRLLNRGILGRLVRGRGFTPAAR